MNVMDKPLRPRPPLPTARKDGPVNQDYEDRAKRLLREAMDVQGVTLGELTQRLKGIGVTMSAGGVANKISRGGFSAAFYLMCMDVLCAEKPTSST